MKAEEKTAVVTVPTAKTEKASEDYFADFDFSKINPDMEEMLKAGVHFGHQKSRRDPRMEQYIFTTRKGFSIIDLQKTLEKIEEAINFCKEVKKSGKQVLFVNAKKQLQEIVRSAAQRSDMPFVAERWLGGTLTNFKVIRKRAKYLKDSQEKMTKGEYGMYTKLERLKIVEELEKLEKKMGGIKNMTELPGALFVTDTKECGLALKEAKSVGVQTIGIVDTNCNPDLVDYPIPANDDAVSSVRLILSYICKALMQEEKKDNQK